MKLRARTVGAICVALALWGDAQLLATAEPEHDETRAEPEHDRTRAEPTAERTEAYLRTLDVADFIHRGTDFDQSLVNLELIADQLGRRVDELTNARDYDFDRLEEIERRLEGVDRERALAAIYERVTGGATSGTEKHIALADFLAKAIRHVPLNPTYRDRLRVKDPLVLLTLGEGNCGRVSAVAVDLWRSAGMEARKVALGQHVVAELYYDDGWHYLDTDNFGGIEMVRKPDGTIPSLAELSRTPLAIDRPASLIEPTLGGGRMVGSPRYPSYKYFGECPECERPKAYIYKTGTRSQQEQDLYFGWHPKLTRREEAKDILLSNLPARFHPSSPRFTGIKIRARDGPSLARVKIRWRRSIDTDKDLLGYRVYVSRQSRGWSYNPDGASPKVLPYWSHPDGWQPLMYERLYELPPSEVALLTVRGKRVQLELEPGHNYYVTVMPFDAHGEAVGREIYCASQELNIPL